jgi:hypothetical protein
MPVYKGYEGFDALMKFFDIDSDLVSVLFGSSTSHFDMVIERFKEVIAGYEYDLAFQMGFDEEPLEAQVA